MYGPSYLNDSFEDLNDDIIIDIPTYDTNSLNNISNIKQREERMFKKINEIHDLKYNSNNNCNFDICDVRGNQRFNYHKVKDSINYHNDIINKQPIKNVKKIKSERIESFNNKINNIKFLQIELDEMKRNNNNLIMFLLFLVIIVLLQYTKLRDINFILQEVKSAPSPV
jgi:hypothetical protein